ncbi:MAG: hypothetical protein ACLQO7_14755, partial [Candidatus Bathyarchaeia archaeon]
MCRLDSPPKLGRYSSDNETPTQKQTLTNLRSQLFVFMVGHFFVRLIEMGLVEELLSHRGILFKT